ncbi:thiosulfate dehydrogenase [quinone] large subunit [Gracilibacillus ureilyticus]|uniref:Thiosulfate dehydrogenase [quinone] large subunit n=1 Tax=Gracilibacillus ureilyticus TaxID=531814 RepID=A0A1H9PPW6_9BACI|nr:DoxX family protein [Gracilibacillus ureilyticus]SER50217.1 thiosulfate dehydrogenase [quinone] large subunit [Gracilibacillus ureilyticus]
MFVEFLRSNKIVAGLLAIIRIYLGYQWMTAGWGKMTGGFEARGFLQGAIEKASGDHPAVQGWWAAFLEKVALPGADLFTFLVMWGELLVGIALILGVFTNFAALMGIIMNFAFVFSGTVSTNGQMILLTAFLLVAGYNAGKFGLDRFVIPFLRHKVMERKNRLKGVIAEAH